MDFDAIDWVIDHLRQNGASQGELLIARKRGEQLVEISGARKPDTARFILDTLKVEYGISTRTLDKDQELRRRGTIRHLLSEIGDLRQRGEVRRRWLRRGRMPEGD